MFLHYFDIYSLEQSPIPSQFIAWLKLWQTIEKHDKGVNKIIKIE